MMSYLVLVLVLLFEFISMRILPSEARSLHHRKSTRLSKRRHKQLYGVSLSSITGFEKPMVPPHIINNDLPINNISHKPTNVSGTMNLDLPSRITLLNETDQYFLIYPLQ